MVMDFHAGQTADEHSFIFCCQRNDLCLSLAHGKQQGLKTSAFWSTAQSADPVSTGGGGGNTEWAAASGSGGIDSHKMCFWVPIRHTSAMCALKYLMRYALCWEIYFCQPGREWVFQWLDTKMFTKGNNIIFFCIYVKDKSWVQNLKRKKSP